jgi:hypothetical protein
MSSIVDIISTNNVCLTDECIICLHNDDDKKNNTLKDISHFRSNESHCKCKYFIHNLCFLDYVKHKGHHCMLCKKHYLEKTETNTNTNNFTREDFVIQIDNDETQRNNYIRTGIKQCFCRLYMVLLSLFIITIIFSTY